MDMDAQSGAGQVSASPEIMPFTDNTRRACPKCDREPMQHIHKIEYCSGYCGIVQPPVEHLHVTCWRCGFRWLTYTADYVAPSIKAIEIPDPIAIDHFEQLAEQEVEELLN